MSTSNQVVTAAESLRLAAERTAALLRKMIAGGRKPWRGTVFGQLLTEP